MINLFTSYYTSQNPERQREIDTCLQKNIENKLINKIYLFLDRNVSIPFQSDKIEIMDYRRPTYSDFINFINHNNLENSYNMISNTDIYFDDSLSLLDEIDMRDTCLVLNRWDILENGSPKFLNTKGSQDVWIFKGKINKKLPEHTKFYLGKKCCDNVFAYFLSEIGYRCISPSYDIRCYHLHISNFRTWTEEDKVKGPHKYILQCRLEEVKKGKLFTNYYDDSKPVATYLFVQYYIPNSIERHKEMLFCLEENIKNNFIDKIYLFSEVDDVPDFIFNESVDVVRTNQRSYYRDFINFINYHRTFRKSNNIIANSDVFFDSSLEKINKIITMKNKRCLALSRHDVDGDKNIVKAPKQKFAETSQDCWIFRGHILGNMKEYCKFPLGVYGCDNRFAHEIIKAGYRPFNYCYDIMVYHYHQSGIRPQNKNDKVPGPYKEVPIARL